VGFLSGVGLGPLSHAERIRIPSKDNAHILFDIIERIFILKPP
jgi:hypothetical protein